MTTWTDPNLTTSTHIRAVHINELRAAVNSNRASAGLTGYTWSDGPTVGTGTHIRARHAGEIRSAVQDLWFIKRMGALPNWSAGSPPVPTRQISLRDITDLRTWVNTYENTAAPHDPQGINSFCYDPSTPPTVVSDSWCQDVVNLKPSGNRLLIRTKLTSKQSDNDIIGDDVLNGYKSGLDIWSRNGFGGLVGGIITAEFDRPNFIPGQSDPNAPLGNSGNGPLTNVYIDDLLTKAEVFVQQVAPRGMKTFWIWNEPNVSATQLSASNYGAMVHTVGTVIKAAAASVGVNDAKVYAGSVSVRPAIDRDGQAAATYLSSMYQYLNGHGVGGTNAGNNYGWDAISLNMEDLFDGVYVATIYLAIKEAQSAHYDYSDLLIGEWGVQNYYPPNANPRVPFDPNQALTTYNALRSIFPTMYFFEHPILVPGDPQNFGARPYSQDSGTFTPVDPPLLWYNELKTQLYPLAQ